MLTDEDIRNLYEKPNESPLTFARAVIAAYEAKLREQNEPLGYYCMDIAKFEEGTQDYHSNPEWTPLFEHPAPIPEGYQLVPVEPTEAMMWALYGHWVGQLTHLDYGYYKAMLNAAKDIERTGAAHHELNMRCDEYMVDNKRLAEEIAELREQVFWLKAARPNIAVVAENERLKALCDQMASVIEDPYRWCDSIVVIREIEKVLTAWRESK